MDKFNTMGARPVERIYPISSNFGDIRHEITLDLDLKNILHKGIDFKCPEGTPCKAYLDGFIQIAHDNQDGLGQRIWLYCDLPHSQKAIRACYAHLQRFEVKVGDHVKINSIIGYSGNTGKTTGPHLHFETRYLPEDIPYQAQFYTQEV